MECSFDVIRSKAINESSLWYCCYATVKAVSTCFCKALDSILLISLVSSWANCMPQYDGQDERNNPPIITPQFVPYPQASALPPFTPPVARWLTLSPTVPLRYYRHYFYQPPVTFFNPPPYRHYAFNSHQFTVAPNPPFFVTYPTYVHRFPQYPQILQSIIGVNSLQLQPWPHLSMPSYIVISTVLNGPKVENYLERNYIKYVEENHQRPSTVTNAINQPTNLLQVPPAKEQSNTNNIHSINQFKENNSEVSRDTDDFKDFDLQTQKNDIFQNLVNKNTYMSDKLLKFRNNGNVSTGNLTTIVFQPVARAIAGVNGRAIANSLSRALIKKGMNMDIHYEPEAVAVAGPGGIAHAQSDLEISYLDEEDF